MKVKCLRAFRDLKEGVFRKAGDTFEATEERYKTINEAGYGQLIEAVQERKPRAKQAEKVEKPAEPEQANPEGEGELAAETTPRPSRRRSRAQE